MGIEVEYVGFDVIDEEVVIWYVCSIGEKYGKIDCVINNVGGFGGRSFIEGMIIEFYCLVMVLNLDSMFFVLRVVIFFLKNVVGSFIVNYILNVVWNVGGLGVGIYGVLKVVVNILICVLVKELVLVGIWVNVVLFGMIDMLFYV